eukprot:TRINITY_DN15819_c0_g1_i4.p1 TRINITY_DN15819_c0_g1~~TRINITY_DN15819_c0_g1_i4.p1  ORF type:complete len:292 (-),score=15.73 TRINITY_DN15819_c0_g1_i4:25-822(-)
MPLPYSGLRSYLPRCGAFSSSDSSARSRSSYRFSSDATSYIETISDVSMWGVDGNAALAATTRASTPPSSTKSRLGFTVGESGRSDWSGSSGMSMISGLSGVSGRLLRRRPNSAHHFRGDRALSDVDYSQEENQCRRSCSSSARSSSASRPWMRSRSKRGTSDVAFSDLASTAASSEGKRSTASGWLCDETGYGNLQAPFMASLPTESDCSSAASSLPRSAFTDGSCGAGCGPGGRDGFILPYDRSGGPEQVWFREYSESDMSFV